MLDKVSFIAQYCQNCVQHLVTLVSDKCLEWPTRDAFTDRRWILCTHDYFISMWNWFTIVLQEWPFTSRSFVAIFRTWQLYIYTTCKCMFLSLFPSLALYPSAYNIFFPCLWSLSGKRFPGQCRSVPACLCTDRNIKHCGTSSWDPEIFQIKTISWWVGSYTLGL